MVFLLRCAVAVCTVSLHFSPSLARPLRHILAGQVPSPAGTSLSSSRTSRWRQVGASQWSPYLALQAWTRADACTFPVSVNTRTHAHIQVYVHTPHAHTHTLVISSMPLFHPHNTHAMHIVVLHADAPGSSTNGPCRFCWVRRCGLSARCRHGMFFVANTMGQLLCILVRSRDAMTACCCCCCYAQELSQLWCARSVQKTGSCWMHSLAWKVSATPLICTGKPQLRCQVSETLCVGLGARSTGPPRTYVSCGSLWMSGRAHLHVHVPGNVPGK